MAKSKRGKLGRGLSSLVGQPVHIAAEPEETTRPAADTSPSAPPAGQERAAHAEATAAQLGPPSNDAAPATHATTAGDSTARERVDGLHDILISRITPNPHQPRQQFDEGALQRLADSIQREGLMQPIVVRPANGGAEQQYELIAGERRWRAAQRAGLAAIPAVVRDVSDQQAAEWALIENLQREDLNPIERAEAFQHLIDRFAFTHEQIAEHVGVDRSSVSNSLRLLSLCDDVREHVRRALLSGGQAKALAGVTDAELQRRLAERAIRQAWSVRQVEAAVRDANEKGGEPSAAPEASDAKAKPANAHLRDLEQQITEQIGCKARIKPGRKKGTGSLTIEFYSVDHFDALLGRLGVNTD